MSGFGNVLMGLGAGAKSLRRSNMEDEAMQAQREAQRMAMEDRAERKRQQELTLEMAIRGQGYIPEAEATGGPQVTGKTLDDVVGAATGTRAGGMQDVSRYGGGPKGYKYDTLGRQAKDAQLERRLKDAQIRKAERDAAEPYKADKPASEPLETVVEGGRPVLRPRSQSAGKEAYRAPQPEPLVITVGQDGRSTYTPRSDAVGKAAPTAAPAAEPGAGDRRAKVEAAQATIAVLDRIRNEVETNGTDIDPRSPRRAVLASLYAQFQLKLKDAAKLGALSQSDMDIMLNTLNDPTSTAARAKVLGSSDRHRGNVLQGAASIRTTLEQEIARLQGSADDSSGASASDVTDAEFAAAWQAGKRTDADIRAWVRANAGTP